MLAINNLSKIYDNNKGIHELNYKFEEGNIYAIVGPNGVGKTTLMRLIAGISTPTQGNVELDGIRTLSRECKINIGYAIEFSEDYSKLTVYQFLSMLCEIKYRGQFQEKIEEYLKEFCLDGEKNTRICNCSIGMKKKLGLIASFLGDPKVIVLDEPTNGVDTTGLIQLKECMKRARENGQIVVVSSHVLDFIDTIVDEILFLKDGKIVFSNGDSIEEKYKNLYLR